MPGQCLHILQGHPVVQRQGDMRTPQIMSRYVANAGALAAEAKHAHNRLRTLIGVSVSNLGLRPAGHGREDTLIVARLHVSQGT